MKKLWKFLYLKDGEITSGHDGSLWKLGEWRSEEKPTEICNGLNACLMPLDALRYVSGDILALVKAGGHIIEDDEKFTCERMRIIKAWKWRKKDSVELAIYSATLCINNFEKKYPTDDRPRKAIEAAVQWLKNQDKPARSAALSALSAEINASCTRPIRSDTWPAEAAAWSAEAAARSVAEAGALSAEAAFFSAEAAAWSVAEAARPAEANRSAENTKKKINTWIIKHTKSMEE